MSFKVTALLTLVALGVSAQEKKASIAGITEYQYPNGLRVVMIPDASSPKITVNMVYLVGSRHEGYGETGMAHLLEHMLFIQTNTGRNIKKEIVDRGASWNGTTSYDRTNYYETFTASDENLKWALGLEADRMVNVRLEKALLDTEMTVVRNEFERGENSPARVLEERVLSAAYLWHNYGKSVIGSRVDIERVPIERLAAFYRKFYQPDNAVLVLAGNFDTAKTLELVKASIGALPRPARKLDELYTTEPVQDGERYVELQRVGKGKQLMIAYHSPAMAHPDAAVLEVLTGVLNGGNGTGRLPKALVDNKKAVSASINVEELHDPGWVMARATLSDDQSIDDARKAMLDTIASIASEPPTKAEVDRVKDRITTQMERSMGNSQTMAMSMTDLISSGDWRLWFVNYEQVKAVTVEDVVRAAKLYFKDSNRTIGVFTPIDKADRTSVPDTPAMDALLKDFKTSLKVDDVAAFDPSPAAVEKKVVRSRLANGAKLALLAKPSRQGTVNAEIELRFGDERSLAGKNAVASLTGALLMHGTKNHTRQQIDEESVKLKSRVNARGGLSGASASVTATPENLVPALRLAVELLREPLFPEADFEQVRKQSIAAIERGRTEPGVLASELLQRTLSPYPKGNVRYVRTIDEQLAELKAVTLDDVKKFHADFYGASDAVVGAVGPFDIGAFQKIAGELVGGWKSPQPYAKITAPYVDTKIIAQQILTPDKENATFSAGSRIRMTDTNTEFPAMVLANYMFGGSITSHLADRVRNREGLSYSVGSGFNAPVDGDAAAFSASAISNPVNAPKVEASFRDELAKVLKDGFTDAELAIAKKAVREQRVVSRSQDTSLLNVIMLREGQDRTLVWDEQMDAKLQALDAAQVSAAFRKYVDPARISVVKAGDFK